MDNGISFDALLPPEMARKAESIGVRKAEAPALNTLILSILAGAFISLGAVFSTTVAGGMSGSLPFGIGRLVVGLCFSLGLILVVVGGAELFTGNSLIVMAWASKKVSTAHLLRNWLIVYVGNFIGSIVTALVVFLGKQYAFGGGSVAQAALTTANSKVHLDFTQALALGVLCNALVCMAVWLSYSARTVVDKVSATFLPVAAFVAAGFEHCIANMYFVPMALFIKDFDPETANKAATAGKLDLSGLTWSDFLLKNLLPVTLGNVIGGTVFVAAIYWIVYLRPKPEVPEW